MSYVGGVALNMHPTVTWSVSCKILIIKITWPSDLFELIVFEGKIFFLGTADRLGKGLKLTILFLEFLSLFFCLSHIILEFVFLRLLDIICEV